MAIHPISIKCPYTSAMANVIREQRPNGVLKIDTDALRRLLKIDTGAIELDNLAVVLGTIFTEYDTKTVEYLMKIIAASADRKMPVRGQ